jgi:glutamyl-tRNA synthetase
MTTDTNSKKIIVRFAPSPTGNLHIGGVRTALFNYLFAKKYDGKFILRIEDTDKERSKKEYEEGIIESLAWVGMKHEELYRQSERTDIYKKYLKQLVESGHAYVSKEETRESPKTVGFRSVAPAGATAEIRTEVIRFKNPNKDVVLEDDILGEIKVNTTDLGDFVIAKDFETPIFHLTNVVDDYEMGITHVIRAQEHLANTPRQILIQEAIGAPRPHYAHIPLILAPDRTKLSKRHGAVALTEYREQGYLPEAIINYLALLGWNPGGEQEVFSVEELASQFSLEKIQKGGAIFNTEKLDWFNKQHIAKLSPEVISEKILATLSEEVKTAPWFNKEVLKKITPLIQEKIVRFGEVPDTFRELEFFFLAPEYPADLLLPAIKGERVVTPENKMKTQRILDKVLEMLEKIPDGDFTLETIKTTIWDYATEEGRGNVLWPMRFGLTGKEKSPDPFQVASMLGKSEAIERLRTAKERLS